jgi:peroxiredoxin
MTLYNEVLPEFEKFNAQIIGISVDGVWSHLAFSKDRKLRFPILSDFEPKGEVARKYGVYRKQDGITERALFVIDKDGIIHWSYVSPMKFTYVNRKCRTNPKCKQQPRSYSRTFDCPCNSGGIW